MKVTFRRCSRLLYVVLDYRLVQQRRTVKLIVFPLLVALLSSCTYAVSTPLMTRVYPEGLGGETKVLITGFRNPGGDCVREEVAAYLSGSKTFVPIVPPEGLNDRQLEKFIEERNVKLVLSGDVDKHWVDSTSIGPAVHQLRLVVVTSAKITVVDARTDETIWSLKDSIALNEYGRGIVPDSQVEKGVAIACKNLVTKMLNDFAQKYATYDKRM